MWHVGLACLLLSFSPHSATPPVRQKVVQFQPAESEKRLPPRLTRTTIESKKRDTPLNG